MSDTGEGKATPAPSPVSPEHDLLAKISSQLDQVLDRLPSPAPVDATRPEIRGD